ncbi:MAG TPA: ATP-binding protein [Verrucomicrobiae bacterium]|nr:ATP-binding protein [Verrucomicrobiae bacterium]
MSLFFISSLLLKIRDPAILELWMFGGLIKLVAATFIVSVGSYAYLRRFPSTAPAVAYFQTIWDLLFVTTLVLFTGGIASPYSFLYLLAIMTASVLLARRQALYAASLCAILYGGMLDLQYYGALESLGLSRSSALIFGEHYIFYNIFINIVAFYLTAFLTGYLSERARKSEQALEEKVIDFEELERLNASIVRCVNSGLVTLNKDGRIRVFNAYAEKVTGISQKEAYDRRLQDIFPSIDYRSILSASRRGEMGIVFGHSDRRVIRLTHARLRDKNGRKAGVILNFHDITEIRRMEDALKRADRMAAVGALSARIAHEIRNPLASISGAVQLISQRQTVAAEDRRLLEITVTETERLDLLIRDFLEYAAPRPPARTRVRFESVVHDLQEVLTSDARFAGVAFDVNVPDGFTVYADVNQLKQVLWNLLLNAAEAMVGGGVIHINGSHTVRDAPSPGRFSRIDVRDSGPGISPEDLRHVFEPFFSTKASGSGLGLATVFRIVESHNGVITVESDRGEGTCFSLFLEQPFPRSHR